MKRRLGVWVAIPVLFLMLGFIAVLATSEDSGSRSVASPLLGRQAPPIVGETIDGGAYDLATSSGDFVIVNFFATWCTPCVVEHPELVNFEKRHRSAGDASVISVVYDASTESVRNFFADNGGEWPVVEDPDGRIALDYGVAGVPESYLIGPDGVVVTKLVGGVTSSGLDRVLAEAQEAYR
ncbi:TlpA family protein disulfide reductase [Actinospongicola halichondriae]|uniref:TlpA family protein disulfide reductase n=1 Tax=Actinospongicola halichondriae TaxID=3236844 RepID=UPI003D3CF71D